MDKACELIKLKTSIKTLINKDYLNVVVQNKLNRCQQLITKKQKQPQSNLVAQTFEHKIANVLKNTVNTDQQGSQPLIYNMRVMDSQQASE